MLSDLQAHDIAELCEHSDIKYPNNKIYHDAAANKYIGIIMGKIFEEQKSVVIDNYIITRCEKDVRNEKSKRDKLSKVYRIETLQSKNNDAPCTQCT